MISFNCAEKYRICKGEFMTEEELEKIADEVPMIIAGFAFTPDENGFIQVLNLYNPDEK